MNSDSYADLARSLFITGAIVTLTAVGIAYTWGKYERVDNALQYENLQNSDELRRQTLEKVSSARDTWAAMAVIESQIQDAIETSDEPEAVLSQRFAQEKQDYNALALKYNRLVNEIENQVSEWERANVVVPIQVSEFLQEHQQRGQK